MAQVPKSNPGLISVPQAWPPARNSFVVNLQQTGLSGQARNRSGTGFGTENQKKSRFWGGSEDVRKSVSRLLSFAGPNWLRAKLESEMDLTY